MSDVSVVMVVAGEPLERVRRALAAVLAQEEVAIAEILVGAPTPDVEWLAEGLADSPVPVIVLANPTGERAVGLNRCLEAARGRYICRVDARSLVPPDYVRRCVERLAADPRVGVVGGRQKPVTVATGAIPEGVARALANPWALGGAAYRRGRTGPADTVYLGVFRRADLVLQGGWDERLLANEDYELCERYRSSGCIVWVEDGLDVGYEARGTYAALSGQYRAFGRSKVAYWRLTRGRPARRQLAALGIALLATALAIRSPRRAAWTAPFTIGGVLVIDARGSSEGARWAVRAAASVAIGVIWVSWTVGVLEAAVGPAWRS